MHLWREGLNYNAGTGHGVVFFLNVHEPPGVYPNPQGERGKRRSSLPGMLPQTDQVLQNRRVWHQDRKPWALERSSPTAIAFIVFVNRETLFPSICGMVLNKKLTLLTQEKRTGSTIITEMVLHELTPLLG